MSDEARQAKEAGVFGRAAATYDRIGPRYFSHFGERLVEWAGLAPGANVLDVAVGRGAVMFPAARRVGRGGRVIGIDISEDMLRETAAEMQGAEWRNVELRRMDAEQLQFPDGAFDCVLCGFALWFFPHPQRALEEFSRVLKPDGRLGLTTWAADSPIQNLYRQTLRSHLPEPSQATGSAEPQRFNTKEKLEAALLGAGFEAPEIVAEEHDLIYAAEELLWQQLWSAGMRRYLERMTAPVLEQARADLYRRLQALKQPDGIHAVYRALFASATRP
ncbi:MAG: methyltransferase domain-containing protein [Betaproteobacteria bacterium]|nr:methyltransferase domain-containing protein [Betaproteobacteria bacterium]